MKEKWTKEFDDAVVRFFQPLANRFGFPLKRWRDGIYEITGRTFVMRIRQGMGHRKDFVVTLAPKMALPDNLDDLSREIGLGVIAEYSGEILQAKGDFQNQFEEAAKAAEIYCIPYLLETKKDFEEMRNFVKRRVEETGIKTKKYHFPRNVREEWI